MAKLILTFSLLCCLAAQVYGTGKVLDEGKHNKDVDITITASKTLRAPTFISPTQMLPSVLDNVYGVITNKAELLRKMLVYPIELKLATIEAARSLLRSSKTIEIDIQKSAPTHLLTKEEHLLKKKHLLEAHELDHNLVETDKKLLKDDKEALELKPELELEKKEKLLLVADKPALDLEPALALDKKDKVLEKEHLKKEKLGLRSSASHVVPEDLDSQA